MLREAILRREEHQSAPAQGTAFLRSSRSMRCEPNDFRYAEHRSFDVNFRAMSCSFAALQDADEDSTKQTRTHMLELVGSLRELEQCFMHLASCGGPCNLVLSPRTFELYTAGPLSLKGPPGTIPSIPGLQPVPCGLSPLKAAAPAEKATSRVRRCALLSLVNAEKECAMVICCFDSWRMLMQCCKQYNLGAQKTPELLQRHEREIANFRRSLEENDVRLLQMLRDAVNASQDQTSMGEQCKGEPACGLNAMSALLDEAEQEMDGAKMNEELVSRLISRVEDLELEKALLIEELAQVRNVMRGLSRARALSLRAHSLMQVRRVIRYR